MYTYLAHYYLAVLLYVEHTQFNRVFPTNVPLPHATSNTRTLSMLTRKLEALAPGTLAYSILPEKNPQPGARQEVVARTACVDEDHKQD